AVVEIGAPVPLSIPPVPLYVPAHFGGFRQAALREGNIAPGAGNLCKLYEYVVEKKAQPDALAHALDSHQIHAVVPVTGAHERQPVTAESETPQDGVNA